MHKSGNEVHISCGDPALFEPHRTTTSLGKKLDPLPREPNPKGWVPTARISPVLSLWGSGRLVMYNYY